MRTYRTPTLKTEMVTFRSGAESISSFLVLPGGCGRHGGVIALHEWWGLNDWVKMQARLSGEWVRCDCRGPLQGESH